MLLPATAQRVPQHTAEQVNRHIAERTPQRLSQLAQAGPEAINRRLEALEQEWDIERWLEANASTLMLLGVGLGAAMDRRWLLLPGLVAGFLLQHALQGWCPPVPVFRRLGVRTAREIDEERFALKTLRGDFDGAAVGSTASGDPVPDVLQRVRR